MPCPKSLGKPVARLGVVTPQTSCPILVGKQHLGCFCGVENGQVLSTLAATRRVWSTKESRQEEAPDPSLLTHTAQRMWRGF